MSLCVPTSPFFNHMIADEADDAGPAAAVLDVLAVPSVGEEGFGLTVLEGMAASRPVVVFASGGLPEFVRDGETGLVVPKGDAVALAAAVLRALNDPALARRLGAAGRRCAARFTLKAQFALRALRANRGELGVNHNASMPTTTPTARRLQPTLTQKRRI